MKPCVRGSAPSTRRRLQQNNRHMMDIFFPHGLRRDGDGWKLSARIRFVHTRIRTLLAKSDDWDHEAWGIPVSAAHLGFAISVFSKHCSSTERNSVCCDIWRGPRGFGPITSRSFSRYRCTTKKD